MKKAAAFVCAFMLVMVTGCAKAAGWTPSGNPTPMSVLNEARGDIQAQRYDDALGKLQWIHRNSEAPRTARTVALDSWGQLAVVHPPALKAFVEVRKEAEDRIMARKGRRDDFAEFTAINNRLGDWVSTAALFLWLDENDPALATQSYLLAQESLVEAKQYRLCSKYIDIDKSMGWIEKQRAILRIKDPQVSARSRAALERFLTHDAAMLVGLLAINARYDEADKVVAALSTADMTEDLKSALQAARHGRLPPRLQ